MLVYAFNGSLSAPCESTAMKRITRSVAITIEIATALIFISPNLKNVN